MQDRRDVLLDRRAHLVDSARQNVEQSPPAPSRDGMDGTIVPAGAHRGDRVWEPRASYSSERDEVWMIAPSASTPGERRMRGIVLFESAPLAPALRRGGDRSACVPANGDPGRAGARSATTSEASPRCRRHAARRSRPISPPGVKLP